MDNDRPAEFAWRQLARIQKHLQRPAVSGADGLVYKLDMGTTAQILYLTYLQVLTAIVNHGKFKFHHSTAKWDVAYIPLRWLYHQMGRSLFRFYYLVFILATGKSDQQDA